MAAPRPGPSSSSAPFLTGGGFEHLHQQQQQQQSGGGGHGGFASASPPGSSWFEQGGGILPPASGAAFGGGFGFGGNNGGYEVNAGYNGCGEPGPGPGFAALSNAMSCGYSMPGLFSPMLYGGAQEGMALWQGGGLMPVPVPVGERKVGVRKREVEEDLVMVERGGGCEGEEEEEEEEMMSSGSEDSRSSWEKRVVLLRRRRDKGGGKKVMVKKALASSDSPSEDLLRPEGGRKKRREMESPVPWTEEMVRFLFETYDDVHRRLWIESRGKVKNQKKWDPIIRTMQDKFGREFTKNQCESKYWKVRRECARFKSKNEKRAVTEPQDGGSNSKAGAPGRDVMKPKFYDVWLEVAGNDPVKMPEIELSSGSGEEDNNGLLLSPGGGPEEGAVSPFHHTDKMNNYDNKGRDAAAAAAAPVLAARPAGPPAAGGCTVREMKQFLSWHHEAAEKREEEMNHKAGVTMEAVQEHLQRMEHRGTLIDDTRKAQLSMLQGVENKLDRLLHGLTTLNGNIGAMVGRLATFPQR